jgi:predicted RND superfamily exporter protein
MGILTIALSMMLAYFMYAVVFQVHYFGAVNLLVVFVCLGIAVDDIFVVVNAFKHTKDMYAGHENPPTDPDELLRYRLGTSFRKSASAVFLTSFTTAASVLTNMLSPLQGVRTFVLFMATIVMMCYVLTVTVFPAVIVIWARQFEGKPSRLSCAWANRWPSLTASMSKHLENKHIPFFIGTPLRRAVSLLVFLALLVASIALCTQLQVTGAELQILGKGKNYQRWVETRNYYGDTSTTACQSCQSIAPALMMQDAALGTVALTPAQLSAMSGAWVPPSRMLRACPALPCPKRCADGMPVGW